MTVYPAAGALLLLWLWMAWRDPDGPLRLVVMLLPFGMFAAIDAGGLSLVAAHLVAAMAIAQITLRWFSPRGLSNPVPIPPAGVALAMFSLYALLAALLLVRLFAGKFLIFPMAVSQMGIKVSDYFPSTMAPLAPGSSNIAQTLYILLACLVFFCVYGMVRRRGAVALESALVWAAVINLVLGMMDLAALDPILSVIRTAHYTLNNEHTMAGLPRVIGGFAEASSFGAFSAALAAYFGTSFLIARRPRDGLLALAMLACAVLSLSSSGIVSSMAGGALLCLHMKHWLGTGMDRRFGHWLIIVTAAIIALIALLMLSPSVTHLVGQTMDSLMFSKAESSSGIERSAWARSGFDAFIRTWGLGAGPGSLRSNGLVAVLLGTVGLPGALCFAAFIWLSFGPLPGRRSRDELRPFISARVSAMTMLTAMLLSGTTPDPTLHLALLAGLACAIRQRLPLVEPLPADFRFDPSLSMAARSQGYGG